MKADDDDNEWEEHSWRPTSDPFAANTPRRLPLPMMHDNHRDLRNFLFVFVFVSLQLHVFLVTYRLILFIFPSARILPVL